MATQVETLVSELSTMRATLTEIKTTVAAEAEQAEARHDAMQKKIDELIAAQPNLAAPLQEIAALNQEAKSAVTAIKGIVPDEEGDE